MLDARAKQHYTNTVAGRSAEQGFAKGGNWNGTTHEEEARLSYVTAEEPDQIVRPEPMIGPG